MAALAFAQPWRGSDSVAGPWKEVVLGDEDGEIEPSVPWTWEGGAIESKSSTE
jgi:hypothetical protein